MCHNSLEFSQEVIENCAELLNVVREQILKSSDVLMRPNPSRSVHASLTDFIDFLFSKSTSIETVYRQECMKLWQGLVTNLQGNQLSFKTWIKAKYVPEKKKRSNTAYWSIIEILFEAQTTSQKTSAVSINQLQVT